jgi:hypothetical protein
LRSIGSGVFTNDDALGESQAGNNISSKLSYMSGDSIMGVS